MSSFLDAVESGLGFVKSNPVIQQYAGPVLKAILTGSSELELGGGSIVMSQSGGQPVPFTLGKAGLALEEFLLTGDVDITLGTTEIKWVPKSTIVNQQPITNTPVQNVPAPAAS